MNTYVMMNQKHSYLAPKVFLSSSISIIGRCLRSENGNYTEWLRWSLSNCKVVPFLIETTSFPIYRGYIYFSKSSDIGHESANHCQPTPTIANQRQPLPTNPTIATQRLPTISHSRHMILCHYMTPMAVAIDVFITAQLPPQRSYNDNSQRQGRKTNSQGRHCVW